ncbi:hypothetical protein [Tenacibaculum maritimum]|uniref:hypothetical protein n=1 Tax=Tenacibaculum maritimum TaxID=107401 RepID=UPI0038771079
MFFFKKAVLFSATILLLGSCSQEKENPNKKFKENNFLSDQLHTLEAFSKKHQVHSYQKESMNFFVNTLSLAKDLLYQNNSTTAPKFTNWITLERKVAGDNPSTNYYSAFISNKHTYKIKGNKGKALYIGIQVYGKEDGFNYPSGNISSREITIEANGDYEIILSKENLFKDTNWLPIQEEDYIVIIREYYDNYQLRLSDLKTMPYIENTSSVNSKETNTKNEGTKSNFSSFVTSLVANSIDLTNSLSKFPNSTDAKIILNPKNAAALFPSKNIFYEGVYLSLQNDEIAKVTVQNQPKCDYFSWTFYSPYYTTPNYLITKTQLTKEDVKIDEKGNYFFYIAKQSLNIPNAIETGNYNSGVLSFRFLKSDKKFAIEKLSYDIQIQKIQEIL